MVSKDLKILSERIQAGLDLSAKRMLDFKRYKNTSVVILENGQIKEVSPDQVTLTPTKKG